MESDYEDSEDDELDDLLSHIDDDYDSVNAEKGNRDKGNDVSTKLI